MNLLQFTILIAVVIGTMSFLAADEPHWAFRPVSDPAVPMIKSASETLNDIDRFLIESKHGLDLTPACKHTLLRRAYFDLIGLPPTPDQVRAFLADNSPDSFAKVVDELLASPHYGERWGRHWLDLARYGDSNGGDENHAYPFAWRYRSWVISAFNRDLPYDQFVREQLAGDLLEPATPDRLTATGFLAIGTKILAEKDLAKKRADTVDEQIDTMGRVFLGLSLGCARCHDHKFDPVPERDYYALAGIFHSTAIENRELLTEEALAAKKRLQEKVAELDKKISTAEEHFGQFVDRDSVRQWEAEDFARGNVVVDWERYGDGIGIISDPGGQKNFAEYDLKIAEPGSFILRLRYAAANSRPGRILVGNEVAVDPAIAKATGGWMPEHQQWHHEGYLELTAGTHVLRIESEPMMSHLDKLQLVPVTDPAAAKEARLSMATLRDERAKLDAELKKGHPKAMAVSDRDVADARINIRGNPHDLGQSVPRGVLTSIGAPSAALNPEQSGRLALARWMTSPDHPLTARVIVNRIWHWHFGEGLVATPDNFGTTGQPPSHPALLDHLTHQFIADGWSLKKLHRRIMLSGTYRMKQERDTRPIRRLEAEAFRDAVLAVSGTLDPNPPSGPPPAVKPQDPSPADLANNRKTYEEYPHRSVYLPVVRSHVYDLFSLLDFPNPTAPTGARNSTTVATQALLMLNNPFLLTKAAELASSVREKSDPLNELHLRLFSRPIDDEQRRWCEEFLQQSGGDDLAWASLCHTLLISNDFLYVR